MHLEVRREFSEVKHLLKLVTDQRHLIQRNFQATLPLFEVCFTYMKITQKRRV